MTFEIGYFILGVLLITVAALASSVQRLPLTETMIYLIAGVVIGPLGLGWLVLDVQVHSHLLERLAEIAVIVSLFTTGLKLRVRFSDPRWRIPLRLAFVSMTITVGLVALVGTWALGLPLGAAILLGAILAPTDPVLASGVQLENAHDRDRLRFSLTGEAGLNDGTAFPFVMLGLGLLGFHEIGAWGWRWWTIDVAWAIVGGLAIGTLLGRVTARLVLWLRSEHQAGFGRNEFLALGLIALSYGTALLLHTYGFLAVFAAGLAFRTLERRKSGDASSEELQALERAGRDAEIGQAPEKAPAYMVGAVLAFNEQTDRIMEVALVLTIGVALSPTYLRFEEIWFIALLFLVIRPTAIFAGMLGRKCTLTERGLLSWFGIRGIGSLYYLIYATNRGLSKELAWELISITLTVIAVSIVVHGITVTPLMAAYRSRRERPVRQ